MQTRTPTQVASHAQKYFIRQQNTQKRKRRASLFDIQQGHGDGATTFVAQQMSEDRKMVDPMQLSRLQLWPR